MREHPFTVDIDVRYNDVDLLGHVNNAIYSSYLEAARVEYLPEVLGTPESLESVLAHLEIDFERRIEIEDSVEVTVQVPELGTSSVPMQYEITADGERAASAETTLVFLDDEHEGTAPIPDEIRERVESHEGL